MNENSNLNEQLNEIEALCSIYGSDWQLESFDETVHSFSIKIQPDCTLFVTMNENYPSSSPPGYELFAPALSTELKEKISTEFQSIYKANSGTPIVYQWIEKLKEIATKTVENRNEKIDEKSVPIKEEPSRDKLEIVHGPVITDRKSTFQGHISRVSTIEQTKSFVAALLDDRSVAKAKHNTYAFRLNHRNGTVLEDFDNDGESQAGGRLLHLLKTLDLTNIMVVVTRWYGGIHLGADRFRHYNDAARKALIQAEIIPK